MVAVEIDRVAAAYCPADHDLRSHRPHMVGSIYCAMCGTPLVFTGIKPRSGIESWEKWPDDVRETLRAWNRSRGLSFRGMPFLGCRHTVFRCSDCKVICEAAGYGVAVVRGRKLCDDCLIELARA